MKCKAVSLILLWIMAWALPGQAQTTARVALVIGNSDYQQRPLKNPVNDAKSISEVLRGLHFDVIEVQNSTRSELENALALFGEKAEQAKIAVAYYAGHGIQVEGENYLIPVNVSLKKRRDLRKLLPLDDLLYEAKQARQLGLVILDACRDNPFADQLAGSLGRSMVGRGLARVERTASNVLVAFATKDNQIAEDGSGVHSPYANALIEHLPQKGVEIRHLFGRVRDKVMQHTDSRQQPFTYGTLGADLIYLAGEKLINKEKLYWENTRRCGKPACYKAYLALYPQGSYIVNAQEWLSQTEIEVASIEPDAEMVVAPPQAVSQPMEEAPSQLLAGVYINNNDGTVTDTRTGLQWLRCSEGQIWELDACKGRAQAYMFSEAFQHAKNMRRKKKSGASGWRLPRKDELLSLVYCSSGLPQNWNRSGDGCQGSFSSPAIHQTTFPNTDDSKFYWTSTDSKSAKGSPRMVNFYNGKLEVGYLHAQRFVRLVRKMRENQTTFANEKR